MARNAKLTIVEVGFDPDSSASRELIINSPHYKAEHIVPVGEIKPNEVQLPGIYVDRIVQATEPKDIEILKLAPSKEDQLGDDSGNGSKKAALDIRHRIARRAAKEINDGDYINLGIGLPTLVPEHLPANVRVWLESENGILGMGPYPTKDQIDP